MDSLGKGVALALPIARKFPYCTLSRYLYPRYTKYIGGI